MLDQCGRLLQQVTLVGEFHQRNGDRTKYGRESIAKQSKGIIE